MPRARPKTPKPEAAPAPAPASSPAPPAAGAVFTPPERPDTEYHSRISILKAWQYPGSLQKAPDFIDRNWAGYHTGDGDHPPQPCLLVPTPTRPTGVATVFVGDYVVRQLTTLIDGLEPDETVEVWAKADFERLFIPKHPIRHEDMPDDESGETPDEPFADPAGKLGADEPDVDAGEAADAAA